MTAKWKASLPKPGSPRAVELGCTCPVFDNARGAGVMGLGKEWWVNEYCPIHRDKTPAETDK